MENKLAELSAEIEIAKAHLHDLKLAYNNEFNKLYKTVKVYPGNIIVSKIKSETNFHCYHEPTEWGRGTHVIVIPIDKYSEDLENQLIDTYDGL